MGADQLKDVLRGEGWDTAFNKAMEQARPRFRQCRGCGRWVCPEACWNEPRGLCKACAPAVVGLVVPAAAAGLRCPHRGADAADAARFCGECGRSLAAAACGKCGAAFAAQGKFCPECGEPRA